MLLSIDKQHFRYPLFLVIICFVLIPFVIIFLGKLNGMRDFSGLPNNLAHLQPLEALGMNRRPPHVPHFILRRPVSDYIFENHSVRLLISLNISLSAFSDFSRIRAKIWKFRGLLALHQFTSKYGRPDVYYISQLLASFH